MCIEKSHIECVRALKVVCLHCYCWLLLRECGGPLSRVAHTQTVDINSFAKKKKSILKCVVLAAHPYEAYKEKTGITQNIRTFQVVCIRQNDQHDDDDAPAPTTIFFYVCV